LLCRGGGWRSPCRIGRSRPCSTRSLGRCLVARRTRRGRGLLLLARPRRTRFATPSCSSVSMGCVCRGGLPCTLWSLVVLLLFSCKMLLVFLEALDVSLLVVAPSSVASRAEWQLEGHDAPCGGPYPRLFLLPLRIEHAPCRWHLHGLGGHLRELLVPREPWPLGGDDGCRCIRLP